MDLKNWGVDERITKEVAIRINSVNDVRSCKSLSVLPKEILLYIIEYMDSVKMRNGRLMVRIPREDERYTLFESYLPPNRYFSLYNGIVTYLVRFHNNIYGLSKTIHSEDSMFVFYKENKKTEWYLPMKECINEFTYGSIVLPNHFERTMEPEVEE